MPGTAARLLQLPLPLRWLALCAVTCCKRPLHNQHRLFCRLTRLCCRWPACGSGWAPVLRKQTTGPGRTYVEGPGSLARSRYAALTGKASAVDPCHAWRPRPVRRMRRCLLWYALGSGCQAQCRWVAGSVVSCSSYLETASHRRWCRMSTRALSKVAIPLVLAISTHTLLERLPKHRARPPVEG